MMHRASDIDHAGLMAAIASVLPEFVSQNTTKNTADAQASNSIGGMFVVLIANVAL